MPTGRANPMWTESPGYHAVHQRIYRERGPASAQTCACGAPARHWAYAGPRQTGDVAPFSPDLGAYQAMCVPCHKAFDLAAH